MSEAKKLYSSDQITRAFTLVEVLAGHELDPLESKEIKSLTGWTGTTTTRMCQALQSAGVAEQTSDGRWRLKVNAFTNIAIAVTHGTQRARSRQENEINNYTRRPY